MLKNSLLPAFALTTACFIAGVTSSAWSAPLAPVTKKTVAKKKAISAKTKKTAAVTPPPPQQTFDTIEDEDLVLIPENEVFATVVRPSTVESSAIAVTASAKPAEPAPAHEPSVTAPANAASETSTEPSTPAAQSAPPIGSLAIAPAVIVVPQSYEYYRVENKDINTLTYRLRIVQAILEESGKAYDYRSLKTKELVKILNRVRMERRAREMNAVLETPQLAE